MTSFKALDCVERDTGTTDHHLGWRKQACEQNITHLKNDLEEELTGDG